MVAAPSSSRIDNCQSGSWKKAGDNEPLALVLFEGSSLKIYKSKNISSITKLNSGRYRLFFINNFPDPYYSVSGGADTSFAELSVIYRNNKYVDVRLYIESKGEYSNTSGFVHIVVRG